MRKYAFHLNYYILHVYTGRPGGYPEVFLNKIKKTKKTTKICGIAYVYFQGSIRWDGVHHCGIVLISPRKGLTTATCVNGYPL